MSLVYIIKNEIHENYVNDPKTKKINYKKIKGGKMKNKKINKLTKQNQKLNF